MIRFKSRHVWSYAAFAVLGTGALFAQGCGKAETVASGDKRASAYIYVANKTDRSISVLSLDASGAEPVVTLVDTLIPDTTIKYEQIRVNAAGTILYATANGDGGNNGTVRSMTIDRSTGLLTSSGTVALTQTTYFAKGLGFDRQGKFLFVSNYLPNTDTLLVPIQLPTTGTTLTEGTALDVTGEQMQTPQAHPTLDVIYSSSIGTREVMGFSVNTTTGDLTQTQAVTSAAAMGNQPRGVAVHPNGNFLVVYHSSGTSALSVFPIDTTGALGTLTTVTQSRTNASTTWYYDFVFHPTLDVAYGVGFGPEVIGTFSVNKTSGTLTELGDFVSTGSSGANPIAMAIDPSGKFAFVVNQGTGTLAVYVINQTTGALTPAATPTVTVGSGPQSIQIVAAP